MTEDYEKQAAAAERELADMEERSERVGEDIDQARKDWDAKVADPSVPGAGGSAANAANRGATRAIRRGSTSARRTRVHLGSKFVQVLLEPADHSDCKRADMESARPHTPLIKER
jgi:hypothetical protein